MKAKLALVIVAVLARAALADVREECIASSSSAQDLRRESKLVESRTQLLVCAREACPKVIQRDCAQWLGEVDLSIPTIVVAVRDAQGVDVMTARVLVDGVRFQDTIDGNSRTINPGVHRIRVEVGTTAPLDQEIVIREGEKNRLVELVLSAPPAPPTTEPVVGEPPATTTTPSVPGAQTAGGVAPTVEQGTANGVNKLLPWIVGGSAVTLFVGALGFELWGRSYYDDAQDEDVDQRRRDSLYDSANRRRYVGEGLAIAGVGCLAVAVWLYVRSRGDVDTTTAKVTPAAGADLAGLALIGTFW